MLEYFGGPVLSNVQVFVVYYGQNPLQNDINKFYQNIVNSSYIDWLSEYNTPTQRIGRGGFIGSYTYDTMKTQIDNDNDLVPLLQNLIKHKRVPSVTTNTYYAIHLAPGISLTKGGGKSCEAFCAYHGTIDLSYYYNATTYLYYGLMPDYTTPPCSTTCR